MSTFSSGACPLPSRSLLGTERFLLRWAPPREMSPRSYCLGTLGKQQFSESRSTVWPRSAAPSGRGVEGPGWSTLNLAEPRAGKRSQGWKKLIANLSSRDFRTRHLFQKRHSISSCLLAKVREGSSNLKILYSLTWNHSYEPHSNRNIFSWTYIQSGRHGQTCQSRPGATNAQ